MQNASIAPAIAPPIHPAHDCPEGSPLPEVPRAIEPFQTFRVVNVANGAVLQRGFASPLLPQLRHDEDEAAEFSSRRMAEEVLRLVEQRRRQRYAAMHMPFADAYEVRAIAWQDGTVAWKAWNRLKNTGVEYAVATAESMPEWMRKEALS